MKRFIPHIATIAILAGGIAVARTVNTLSSTDNGTWELSTDDSGTMTETVDRIVVDRVRNVAETKSVTNSAVITATNTLLIVTGTGGANDSTNTVTIANPDAIGVTITLMVDQSSTNLIGLADSGNLKLSAAFNGDNNDTISLMAQTTTSWVETARSNN